MRKHGAESYQSGQVTGGRSRWRPFNNVTARTSVLERSLKLLCRGEARKIAFFREQPGEQLARTHRIAAARQRDREVVAGFRGGKSPGRVRGFQRLRSRAQVTALDQQPAIGIADARRLRGLLPRA